ncbi:MAG: helix-turn-helix domain-containing protein, partial [Gammaproteobacteria bacterium]
MKRTEVLQGLRHMKFATVKGRWAGGELNQAEAGEILGVSERTFRRWYQRYEEEGLEGLNDRRLGRPSPKRVPEEWELRVEQLYRERYQDFTAKHFHEHLVRDHALPGATAGPRRSCTSAGCCPWRRARGYIARSGYA